MASGEIHPLTRYPLNREIVRLKRLLKTEKSEPAKAEIAKKLAETRECARVVNILTK